MSNVNSKGIKRKSLDLFYDRMPNKIRTNYKIYEEKTKNLKGN